MSIDMAFRKRDIYPTLSAEMYVGYPSMKNYAIPLVPSTISKDGQEINIPIGLIKKIEDLDKRVAEQFIYTDYNIIKNSFSDDKGNSAFNEDNLLGLAKKLKYGDEITEISFEDFERSVLNNDDKYRIVGDIKYNKDGSIDRNSKIKVKKLTSRRILRGSDGNNSVIYNNAEDLFNNPYVKEAYGDLFKDTDDPIPPWNDIIVTKGRRMLVHNNGYVIKPAMYKSHFKNLNADIPIYRRVDDEVEDRRKRGIAVSDDFIKDQKNKNLNAILPSLNLCKYGLSDGIYLSKSTADDIKHVMLYDINNTLRQGQNLEAKKRKFIESAENDDEVNIINSMMDTIKSRKNTIEFRKESFSKFVDANIKELQSIPVQVKNPERYSIAKLLKPIANASGDDIADLKYSNLWNESGVRYVTKSDGSRNQIKAWHPKEAERILTIMTLLGANDPNTPDDKTEIKRIINDYTISPSDTKDEAEEKQIKFIEEIKRKYQQNASKMRNDACQIVTVLNSMQQSKGWHSRISPNYQSDTPEKVSQIGNVIYSDEYDIPIADEKKEKMDEENPIGKVINNVRDKARLLNVCINDNVISTCVNKNDLENLGIFNHVRDLSKAIGKSKKGKSARIFTESSFFEPSGDARLFGFIEVPIVSIKKAGNESARRDVWQTIANAIDDSKLNTPKDRDNIIGYKPLKKAAEIAGLKFIEEEKPLKKPADDGSKTSASIPFSVYASEKTNKLYDTYIKNIKNVRDSEDWESREFNVDGEKIVGFEELKRKIQQNRFNDESEFKSEYNRWRKAGKRAKSSTFLDIPISEREKFTGDTKTYFDASGYNVVKSGEEVTEELKGELHAGCISGRAKIFGRDVSIEGTKHMLLLDGNNEIIKYEEPREIPIEAEDEGFRPSYKKTIGELRDELQNKYLPMKYKELEQAELAKGAKITQAVSESLKKKAKIEVEKYISPLNWKWTCVEHPNNGKDALPIADIFSSDKSVIKYGFQTDVPRRAINLFKRESESNDLDYAIGKDSIADALKDIAIVLHNSVALSAVTQLKDMEYWRPLTEIEEKSIEVGEVDPRLADTDYINSIPLTENEMNVRDERKKDGKKWKDPRVDRLPLEKPKVYKEFKETMADYDIAFNVPTYKSLLDASDTSSQKRVEIFNEIGKVINENQKVLETSSQWDVIETFIKSGNPSQMLALFNNTSQPYNIISQGIWLDPNLNGSNLMQRRKNVKKDQHGIPDAMFIDPFAPTLEERKYNKETAIVGIYTNLNDMYAKLKNFAEPKSSVIKRSGDNLR